MEIERKFIVATLPAQEPAAVILLEQGYISTDPVIRIRKRVSDPGRTCEYILTVKGEGLAVRREEEFILREEQYEKLREKCNGVFIRKRRHVYPLADGHTAEVDVFEGAQAGLILAEVEFESIEDMERFVKPAWMGEDVTMDGQYQNSRMVEKMLKENRM